MGARKQAPSRKTAARATSASAVAAARETLTESTTSVRDAAVAALGHLSPGVARVEGEAVTPDRLLTRAFSDPPIGLDDAQMPAFFAAVSTAINDARVDSLIQAKLSGTGAAANIGDIVSLLQLWVDNPDIQA